MTEIKSLTIEELKAALSEMGEKPFRAGQIFRWLHEGVRSFDQMSNLSKDLRARLAERFLLTVPEIARKQVSRLDGTVKYLWQMRDGDCVESVLMHYEHGNTACVSTQVGCRMGCKFCASGLDGLKRHLSPGEILDEILFMQQDSGEKISNIVLMGTGEPLDNYDNVLKFLKLVTREHGLHIGQRHISLSTSGIADKIEMLAGERLQITLSVSLHAPDNETRSSIMPVNEAYPIERLMRACNYSFDTTGRRISYEYMMARDKTDRPWQAERLAALLKGRPAHVNLIPLNEVAESPLKPSSRESVRRFQQALEQRGVTATVRRRLGPDIDAACGQLRRRNLTEQGELSSRRAEIALNLK
jgi:23S rRNA (adenine2503-C2)-methyltransferase